MRGRAGTFVMERAALGAAALALAIPAIATSQAASRTLPSASAALPEEFTLVGSLRELSDGRVIVTDERDNRLLVADFRTNRVSAIGRTGQGPGEFEQVGRLVATRADTTLMHDAAAGRRWLVLHLDEVVATLGPSDSIIAATGGSLLGADSLGRVLTSSPLAFIDVGPGVRRVQRLHRIMSRATLRADSVAAIRAITIETRESGPPGARRTVAFQRTFSVSEQALLFSDGWLALALQDPYRVEWYAPGGTVVRGAPLSYAVVRVDAAEKERWAEGIRRENRGAAFDASGVPFADEIPPYTSGALVGLPDGQLAVRRHPSRRAPEPGYDIIDRRGVRSGTLRLPANARLVGSGRESVYVATKDDDGVERLSRHPWR